jgi:hypothetical protein
MYRQLRCHYGIFTKVAFLTLANAVVENTPEWCRPPFPTRSERRAKAGLITWMDRNTPLVLSYLASNPKPE